MCSEVHNRCLGVPDFESSLCAEDAPWSGQGGGCGSPNIGLAKNQPRVGDCRIRIELLGDSKIPSAFQFEREGDDLDIPVVRVNMASPRYIELRGTGSISAQAQKRLKQFLVDVALVSIAEYHSETKGTAFSQELGELYYNRMLRFGGIRQYETQLSKVMESANGAGDQTMLTTV
jgi:hypothetical protein